MRCCAMLPSALRRSYLPIGTAHCGGARARALAPPQRRRQVLQFEGACGAGCTPLYPPWWGCSGRPAATRWWAASSCAVATSCGSTSWASTTTRSTGVIPRCPQPRSSAESRIGFGTRIWKLKSEHVLTKIFKLKILVSRLHLFLSCACCVDGQKKSFQARALKLLAQPDMITSHGMAADSPWS